MLLRASHRLTLAPILVFLTWWSAFPSQQGSAQTIGTSAQIAEKLSPMLAEILRYPSSIPLDKRDKRVPVIVQVRPDAFVRNEAAQGRHGEGNRLRLVNGYTARLTAQQIKLLLQSDVVEYVTLDAVIRPTSGNPDLETIGAAKAHQRGYDGGGSLGNVFDIGERVVAPYLWYRWIRGLDVVVLSHPQPDHLYGLRAVLENFPVGEVWESGYPSTSSTYRWLHSFVRRRGIPLRRITRGTDIPLGAEVMVKVLHPPQSFLIPGRGHASAIVNNNSLVLRIDYQAFRILLTGDIEKEAEASLLDAGVILQADLLKVPHHGSRGSSSVNSCY